LSQICSLLHYEELNNGIVKDMDFVFTLCSTSLHDKTVAVWHLQKLNADATFCQAYAKTDVIPVSIFSRVQLKIDANSPLNLSYVERGSKEEVTMCLSAMRVSYLFSCKSRSFPTKLLLRRLILTC
jgi:hypothetical protein